MINTSFSNNPFSNVKLSIREKTNSNPINSNSKSLNSNNEVLGYKVDKDGYFTSEFNEAAGIPKDYKIHSSTMESLVKINANKDNILRKYEDIDIAKSIGNAYKILSQVVGENFLNSKDSFTTDDIAQFPRGYEYNRQNFDILNKYSTDKELNQARQGNDNKKIESLFSNIADIFDNNNGGEESTKVAGVFWATTANKYTNKDGSISKGGLLIGVLNANPYAIEGETTIWGKMEGFDKNADSKALRKWFNDEQWQTFPFGDENFMPLMLGTDLDEFMSKYAEYKEKRIKELEENSFTLEDMIREIKKYIELMFGKSDELRKELEEEQKKLFTNEMKLDIKA